MTYRNVHGWWWQRRWRIALFVTWAKPLLLGSAVVLTLLLATTGIHWLIEQSWSGPSDSQEQTWQCDSWQYMTSRVISSDVVILTCHNYRRNR